LVDTSNVRMERRQVMIPVVQQLRASETKRPSGDQRPQRAVEVPHRDCFSRHRSPLRFTRRCSPLTRAKRYLSSEGEVKVERWPAEGGGQQSAISHQPEGNRPDAAHMAGSLIPGASMKIRHGVLDFHGEFRPAIPCRLAAQGPAGEGGAGGACQALPRQSWGAEQTYRRARA